MSSNWGVSSAMCGMCLTLLACDGPSGEPAAPRFARMSTSISSALADFSSVDEEVDAGASATIGAAVVPVGGKASAHVDIFATARQNVVEQTYSLIAASAGEFPLAKGEFEGHALRFTGETVNIHAEVTCMAIVGNQAWIGLRITRATIDEQEVPGAAGTPMTFRVQDNGEGASAADAASLWFLGFADEIAFCNTRPTTNPLRTSTTGNVQVKPE